MANSKDLEEVWHSLGELNESLKMELDHCNSDTLAQRRMSSALRLMNLKYTLWMREVQSELSLVPRSRVEEWKLSEENLKKLRKAWDVWAEDEPKAPIDKDLISELEGRFRQQRMKELNTIYWMIPEWEMDLTVIGETPILLGSETLCPTPVSGGIEGCPSTLVTGTGPAKSRLVDKWQYPMSGSEFRYPDHTPYQETGTGIIRDSEHLHQLKMYLLRKVESQVYLRKLKEFGSGLKDGVSKLCDTLMSNFVTPETTLESELFVSLPMLITLFLDNLEEDMEEKNGKFCLKSFEKLLKKFSKENPLDLNRSSSCFAWLRTRKPFNDQNESDRVIFLQEMIQFQEEWSFSLQQHLKLAKKKNNEARKEWRLREREICWRKMQDAQDDLRLDEEPFTNQLAEQQATSLKIHGEVDRGKGTLEEPNRPFQILDNKLEYGEY